MHARPLAILLPAALTGPALAGLIVLDDARTLTAEAAVGRGAEVSHVGLVRVDRPGFGASWTGEASAIADITDAHASNQARMQSTLTGAGFQIDTPGSQGWSYRNQLPDFAWSEGSAVADIRFQLDGGSQARVGWGLLGAAVCTVTDESGAVIANHAVIGPGVYRLHAEAHSTIGLGRTTVTQLFSFSLNVIPAPASAGLLTLGLAFLRRRR